MERDQKELETEVVRIVTASPERRAIIASVANLGLPVAWIAGGFVRNRVWDELFRAGDHTPATDVDVCYFKSLDSYATPRETLVQQIAANEPNDVWAEEDALKEALEALHPEAEFEVKNQARMYLSPTKIVRSQPYESMEDALVGWVETATASGICQEPDGTYAVLAPFGLEDLFAGIIRPTCPEHTEMAMRRAEQKGWLTLWPGVRFEPYDEIHCRRR